MSWCAVDVRSPAESRDQVAAWLVGHTGQAIEEREDGTLVGFTPDRERAGTLLEALLAAFGAGIEGATRLLPDINWSERWRDGLGPRVNGRLTVTPSWAVGDAADSPTVIVDPESAFGTGEHGSTRTALVLLDRYLREGDRVLDLGSGSGILAIAAVKLGASRATGVEIDADVEPIARANAERNRVTEQVGFLTGDAGALAPLLGPVELLVSNILRSVNLALLPAIRASLTPAGIAIFAGMELEERPLFLPQLVDTGFTAVDEALDQSWWAVAARAR
jgi:ribosomal protein L11 methyltransferase